MTIFAVKKSEHDTISQPSYLKGIFTDSDNIFLWHESEDINKKQNKTKQTNKKENGYFQNFSCLKFFYVYKLHDYVLWQFSIDYCVKLIVVDKKFMCS